MDTFDIISLRLRNQHLTRSNFTTPEEVVDYFGALQAQNFDGAVWSIGLRRRRAKAGDIESVFDAGRILRTHVMRPTWHFIMPEDIRWMLKLTAPRIKRHLVTYDRRLEIDESFLVKCREIIREALEGGKHLTRKDMGAVFQKAGVNAHGLRLGHIMAHMELDAFVCSGPRCGKETTYALLAERVPAVKNLTREQSLAKLASKYFRSHGPAELKDFEWWSGLSPGDVTEAFEFIKEELAFKTEQSKTYYYLPDEEPTSLKTGGAFLLSMFDEYTIAYKDRMNLGERGDREAQRVMAMGNAVTGAIVLNGKIAGAWKRILKEDGIKIALNPFRELSVVEKEALQAEAIRYSRFWDLHANLSV